MALANGVPVSLALDTKQLFSFAAIAGLRVGMIIRCAMDNPPLHPSQEGNTGGCINLINPDSDSRLF